MEWIELRKYNGQFHVAKVRQRLNRKLMHMIKLGKCVLIDADQCKLTRSELVEITQGLAADKFRIRYPWPLQANECGS